MEKMKILVVDDESRMRKLVKDFLTRAGSGRYDAKDGRMAGMPGSPRAFKSSDHYVDSPVGRER